MHFEITRNNEQDPYRIKALKILLLISMVLQGELGRLTAFLAFYEIFLPSAYVLNQCAWMDRRVGRNSDLDVSW